MRGSCVWEEYRSDPGASPVGVSDAEILSSVSLFSSSQLKGFGSWVPAQRVPCGCRKQRHVVPSSYFTKGLSFLRWKALWVNLFTVRGEPLPSPESGVGYPVHVQ